MGLSAWGWSLLYHPRRNMHILNGLGLKIDTLSLIA